MPRDNLIEIFRTLRQPGVPAELDQDEPGWLFGTGFAIDPMHVLTARHVIGADDEDVLSATGIRVRQFSADGEILARRGKIDAHCIWESRDEDVALLRLADETAAMDVDVPRLGRSTRRLTFECHATGFPRGMKAPGTNVRDTYGMRGQLNPETAQKRPEDFVFVTNNPFEGNPDLWKGMSGAALFATRPRALLGVVIQTPATHQGRSLVVFPVARLAEMPEPLAALEVVELVDEADAQRFEDFDTDAVIDDLHSANFSTQLGLCKGIRNDGFAAGGMPPLVLGMRGRLRDGFELAKERFQQDFLPYYLMPIRVADGGDVAPRIEMTQLEIRDMPEEQALAELRAKVLGDFSGTSPCSRTEFADRVRERFNGTGVGPTAFYTYFDSSLFNRNRAQVLDAWLEHWTDLVGTPLGDPVVYLLYFQRGDDAEATDRRGWFARTFGLGMTFDDFYDNDFGELGEAYRSFGEIEPLIYTRDLRPWLDPSNQDLQERLRPPSRFPWTDRQKRAIIRFAEDRFEQPARFLDVRANLRDFFAGEWQK